MAVTGMNLLNYVYISGTMFMKCGNQSVFVKLAAFTLKWQSPMIMQIDPTQKAQKMNFGNHNLVTLVHSYMFRYCVDTTLSGKDLFVY